MTRPSQAKLVIAVALLGTLTVALGIALFSGLSRTAPEGNYYPLAVGDKWTYSISPGTKDYTEEITQETSIDGHNAFAVVIDDSYSYMAKIEGSIYQVGQGEPGQPNNFAVFDPPQLTYQLPFVIGNEWDSTVPSEAMVKDSDTVDVSGEVVSKANVTVPAGTFKDAIKVVIDDPRDAPSERTEVWFAAGVGIIKTITYTVIGNRPPTTSTTELVSYKVLPESR